jgi:hypothetical protein
MTKSVEITEVTASLYKRPGLVSHNAGSSLIRTARPAAATVSMTSRAVLDNPTTR